MDEDDFELPPHRTSSLRRAAEDDDFDFDTPRRPSLKPQIPRRGPYGAVAAQDEEDDEEAAAERELNEASKRRMSDDVADEGGSPTTTWDPAPALFDSAPPSSLGCGLCGRLFYEACDVLPRQCSELARRIS